MPPKTPSLYAQYVAEREPGRAVLETEVGFAKYLISNDFAYIEDIFILPEHRRAGAAASLADSITALAKKAGCKTLLGSVSPQANNATESIKVLLAYGMRLKSSSETALWFVKEI